MTFYRLVIIADDGTTLFINRYKNLKEVQKRIRQPNNIIKNILCGKLIHKHYRIDKIEEDYSKLFNFS
jgi:hypothetical protein